MNNSLKAAGAFVVGALVLTVGYGFLNVSGVDVPLFTKNGTTVTILPGSTLAVETVTAGTLKSSTFTSGGGTRATTSAASATLLVTDIDAERVIEVLPTVLGVTITLPATTTSGMAAIVPNSGDCREYRIVNATTTAGIGLTIAGSAGSLLKNGSSTAVIMTGNVADLIACRRPDTDIIWSLKN